LGAAVRIPNFGKALRYLREWQRQVYEAGWAGLSWPKEYGGRGATLLEKVIFTEEMARAGAPTLPGLIRSRDGCLA